MHFSHKTLALFHYSYVKGVRIDMRKRANNLDLEGQVADVTGFGVRKLCSHRIPKRLQVAQVVIENETSKG